MSNFLIPASGIVSKAAIDAIKTIREHTENPFRCLPDEWIAPVATFAIAKGKLVGSVESFCALVLIQKTKGLTLAGLKAVIKRLTDAEVAATHNWDNQLLADFHGLCALAIRNQRKHEEQKAREQTQNQDSATSVILPFVDASKATFEDGVKLPDGPARRKGRRA